MAQSINADYMKEDDVFPSVAAWEERVTAIVKQGGLYDISETRMMEDYHLVLCANWDNDDIECEAGSSALLENGSLVVAGFTMPHNDRCIAHQRALRNQELQSDNQVQVQQSPPPPYQAFLAQSTPIQPTAPVHPPQSIDPPAEVHHDSQAHNQKEVPASPPPPALIAPQASAGEPIPAQNAIANSDMEMSVDEVVREPITAQQEGQQPIDFRETSTQGPDNPHRLLLQYAARSSPSKPRRLSKTSSTEGVLSWLQQQSVIERENVHAKQGSQDHLPTLDANHSQSTAPESSSSGVQEQPTSQDNVQSSAGVEELGISQTQSVSQVQRKPSPPIPNEAAASKNAVGSPASSGSNIPYMAMPSSTMIDQVRTPSPSASIPMTGQATNSAHFAPNDPSFQSHERPSPPAVPTVPPSVSDGNGIGNMQVDTAETAPGRKTLDVRNDASEQAGTPIETYHVTPSTSFTSKAPEARTSWKIAAEDMGMASVDADLNSTRVSREEAITASSGTAPKQQEQQQPQAGTPEPSRSSEPRDNLVKLVNAANAGLLTQNDFDRLKDFIEQQGGSAALGVPPLQSNTLVDKVSNVNIDMQIDDIATGGSPSQHAVLPSDRDEQASSPQAEDKQADTFSASENPQKVTDTAAASSEQSASTPLQQSSNTVTAPVAEEPQDPTGSTSIAQAPAAEGSPVKAKAALDDMVTDEARATTLHASQDIPAPPSAASTASAPIRSTSPPKDSAVSSGKYYFSMAALKESMKTWHATRYPGRVEHAGMLLERPGPFEAPYLICRAKHEGHVDDCPLSVTFAIMPDRQSYKVTTSITEHSAACDKFASGPAPIPKPAQPVVTAHVQPESTVEPIVSARPATAVEAEAATSTSTTAPPKKASKPKSRTATPEAAATAKRNTPGNVSSKVAKDLQNSSQAGKKTSSNPFGFSFRKITDVNSEAPQSSTSSAKETNSLKSMIKSAESIYELPTTIVQQSSSGLPNGLGSKNTTSANGMKAVTASVKPSSAASKASSSSAKPVSSGSTQSNSSARPRGRPKGSTKAAIAAKAAGDSTIPATASTSISTVKTISATTEKHRNKPDSASNTKRSTLPSVEGKIYDYARPLTKEDEHDPDFFRVGRQFESYESFDKCLAAWNEKAFPDDYRKRYIARRENRNDKPRVNCSLREKVMTFKCPFWIKLHPLPGDKGYEVFQSDTRHSDECNKRLEKDHQELLKKQASSSDESSDEESDESDSHAGTTSSKRTARRSASASSRPAKRKPKSETKRKSGLVKSDRFASSSSDSDESSASQNGSESESDNDSERDVTDLAEYSGTRSWRRANKEENIHKMKNNKKKTKTKATQGDESMRSSEESTSSAAESTSGAGSDSEKESPASDIEMADSKIKNSLTAIQAESSSSSESESDSSSDETSSMSGASGNLPEKTMRTAEKHVGASAMREDVKGLKRDSVEVTGAVPSSASMQIDAVDDSKTEQLPVEPLPKEEPATTNTTHQHEAVERDDFENVDDEDVARLAAARQVTFREQGFEDLLCDRLELHHIRNFQDMIDAGLRETDFEELIAFVFQEEPFPRDDKRFIPKVELHFAKKHLQGMMLVEAALLEGGEQEV